MATEEAATLLPSNAPPQAPRHHARRPQALRVAMGIASAIALVAGSVVAVHILSQHQQPTVATASLSTVSPTTMEAQFGWGTWCSVRAAAGCLFSSDRDKCKEEVVAKCNPDEEAHDNGTSDQSGSSTESSMGSGSGSSSGSSSGSGSGSGMGTFPGNSSHHSVPNVGDPEPEHVRNPKHKKHRNRHHHKVTQGPPRP